MIQIAAQIRILVAVEAIDGRKGIDAVGGGAKGYQNGGEVVPCEGSRSESAFPSSQE